MTIEEAHDNEGKDEMSTITYINDRLYVGGDPEYSEDIFADITLLNQNVDLIIDCRSDEEARLGGWADLDDLDVPILHAPMYDDLENTNNARDFTNAMDRVRREYPEAKSFYIHCHMGVNRGPSMAMFFLMAEFGMTAMNAFHLLRSQRHGVGIAYAEQAVAAMLTESNGQIDADINIWLQFETDYWTPERNQTVIDRVRSNRLRTRLAHRTVTDSRGIQHITKGA